MTRFISQQEADLQKVVDKARPQNIIDKILDLLDEAKERLTMPYGAIPKNDSCLDNIMRGLVLRADDLAKQPDEAARHDAAILYQVIDFFRSIKGE